MRWIAILTATLVGSVALLLLVVLPARALSASGATISAVHTSLANGHQRMEGVQPVGANGKSRWRKRCY